MRIVLVAPSRSDPAHRRVLGALKENLEKAGDEVILFPPANVLASAACRGKLERLLLEKKIDVCHIQFFSRGLGFLGQVQFPRRIKLVLTHQGAALDLMERRDVFNALARRAAAVTAVSSDGLKQLLALSPRLGPRARMIPNGTDFGRPSGRPSAKFPKDSFILSVGRLAAYKGTDLLLMAFAGLAFRDRSLSLVICGPDQTAGRLPVFAEKLGLGGRVHFLGDTKPARVRRLIEGCRLFVLPSRSENMPMALLEAMAAGKAVIASAVGGVGEVVTNGVDGLLVRTQDSAALSTAMRRLAHDARLRKRLGARASIRARSFAWSTVAAAYRRLYTDVVAGHDAPGQSSNKFKTPR